MNTLVAALLVAVAGQEDATPTPPARLHLRRWDTHVPITPVGAHGLGLAGTF